MGFLESLRDRELRGLYRARKLIENADIHLAHGGSHEAGAELGKAKEILFKEGLPASSRSADFSSALVTLSGILLKADRPDEALEVADRALTLTPSAPPVMAAKARALAAKGSYPDAVSCSQCRFKEY